MQTAHDPLASLPLGSVPGRRLAYANRDNGVVEQRWHPVIGRTSASVFSHAPEHAQLEFDELLRRVTLLSMVAATVISTVV